MEEKNIQEEYLNEQNILIQAWSPLAAGLDKGHTCFMPRNTGKAVTNFLTQCVAGTAPSGIIKK